ncbi:MAG: class I SAM-dependent methyltransferase [Armatimonadota bacterium]|nr:class I SAM-dependent methyltransferase [Armatimonadota bacterium]MDR7486942.1 class I SAM-dependent methyltransferase [Armatimonadota bacterium]MDR7533533.1 class I SAM-dependent methyltransferase [Armatimonadota bacterium]MDR7536877.1 class I SAM-dependent methyltransferase [Armatimonadota bacterium]
MMDQSFWERAEVVERFAARPPDDRMVALLATAPRHLRVLDLGCAAGRNAEWLAREGFDVWACDSSAAMVARTRERVALYLGEAEAQRRVQQCRMEDLRPFEAETFDLVVALGVYHEAEEMTAWHRALAETARVLRRGGRLLVQQFSPRSDPAAQGVRRLADHVFAVAGPQPRRMVLLEPDELDALVAGHGFTPLEPSRSTTRPTDLGGHWVNVHGFYARA